MGARWALIGGLAVGVRTEPRFTRDVDLVIAVSDDAQAEESIRRLRALGYEVHSILEQSRAGRLSTVRLIPGGGDPNDPVVDVMFGSSGIEAELVEGAEPAQVFGKDVPVARTGHLIALKLLSVADHRRSDEQDIVELLREADDADLAEAQTAVRLITERGYNRDRDLEAALDDAIARWR